MEAISVMLNPDVGQFDVPVFLKSTKIWHHELSQVPSCIEHGHEAAVDCGVLWFIQVQLTPYHEYKVQGIGDPLLSSCSMWGGFLCSPEKSLKLCCLHMPPDTMEDVPGPDSIDIVVYGAA